MNPYVCPSDRSSHIWFTNVSKRTVFFFFKFFEILIECFGSLKTGSFSSFHFYRLKDLVIDCGKMFPARLFENLFLKPIEFLMEYVRPLKTG